MFLWNSTCEFVRQRRRMHKTWVCVEMRKATKERVNWDALSAKFCREVRFTARKSKGFWSRLDETKSQIERVSQEPDSVTLDILHHIGSPQSTCTNTSGQYAIDENVFVKVVWAICSEEPW